MRNRFGHTALKCYYRFDKNYQAHLSNQIAALVVAPKMFIDPSGFADGATHHGTPIGDNLQAKALYNGS